MADGEIKPSRSTGRTLLTIIGWLLGIFVAFVVVGNLLYKPKPFDPKASCEREFGPGTDAALQCELRLDMEKLREMDADKMAKARRDAGGY